MNVGVLALQGDVPEHRTAFELLVGRGSVRLVREPPDLEAIDALAFPGGESTTISRLVDEAKLRAPLLDRISDGLPVFATCAGLIFLSRRLEPDPGERGPVSLGVLDVTVVRNGYGPQRESFEGLVRLKGIEGPMFPGIFIRAPRIVTLGPDTEAIAHRSDEVVGVRSGKVWGLTFHPELSGDLRLHAEFLRQTLGWTQ